MSKTINIKDKSLSNLTIEGRTGTWYAVHVYWYGGSTFLELESEQHGDEAEHIIVNMATMGEPSEDLGYHLMYEVE